MRFLIVAPRFVKKIGDYYSFPVGPAYISGALKAAGFDVECLNMNHHDWSTLSRVIRQRDIDVVCTGAISPFYRQVHRVLEVARKANPRIKVVGGGGIVSSEPELITELLGLDFGVIGEGEETIVELATALTQGGDFSRIAGLVYRDKDGTIRRNPDRKVKADLDAIPWPDYEGFEIARYMDQTLPSDFMHSYIFDDPREMPIVASRSCPFDCTFCYLPMGRIYRARSLDGFFAEVDYLIARYRPNILSIYDDLFAVKKDRLVEFCSRIKRYGIHWMAQLRVNIMTPEILEMMKDAGCYYISYGLESGSPEILKSMKKKITVEQIEYTLAETRKARIGFQGNFLFGDLNDTVETVQESLDWFRRHPQYQILLIPVGAYPGSELYVKAVEQGKIPDKREFIKAGSPIVNVSKMSDHEYQQMLHELARTANELRLVPRALSRRLKGWRSVGPVYELRFQCPHCQEIQTYRNVRLHAYEHTLAGCRVCHGRFWFPPVYPQWARFLARDYLEMKLRVLGPRKFLVKGLAVLLSTLLKVLGVRSDRTVIEEWIDPLLPRFPARRVARLAAESGKNS
ncbi:MAG TPA: radical SAM protein [Candidatus Nitrosotenuis sp.]|jgi:radical SAM superfamily enzyme YgiQ (UPF0313 family)|nr:radical SAM protein [Candidatus Nitrosotenuis sp.]